jgi:hypothetical protein
MPIIKEGEYHHANEFAAKKHRVLIQKCRVNAAQILN